jgi:uncharacterized protein YraI
MRNRKPEMKDRKPAIEVFWFLHPSASTFTVFPFPFVILFLLLCGMGAALAQGSGTAVVTGAPRVFVRRGPGTQFPPFATLTEGSTVEVQGMRGEWARVSTASGQLGYVKSNFLALPGERRAARQPARQSAVPAATPIHTPAAEARASEALPSSEQNKALAEEVEQLKRDLAAERARSGAQPTAAPGVTAANAQELSTQFARLTAAVEELQRRFDAGRPLTAGQPAAGQPAAGLPDESARRVFPLPETAPQVISPAAVLLAVVGVVAGWLMGSAYSRRQERTRRTRVRF